MEELLFYKNMCKSAGYPEEPQLLWKIGVLMSALYTVEQAIVVVKKMKSSNSVEREIGKNKIPTLMAMIAHTFIYYQAVFSCNLYSRILPTMFFSIVVQILVQWFSSMFV